MYRNKDPVIKVGDEVSVEVAKNILGKKLNHSLDHKYYFAKLLPLRNTYPVKACGCDNGNTGDEIALRFTILYRKFKGKTQIFSVCDQCAGICEESNGKPTKTTRRKL